jgi:hypothetical protein
LRYADVAEGGAGEVAEDVVFLATHAAYGMASTWILTAK